MRWKKWTKESDIGLLVFDDDNTHVAATAHEHLLAA